MYTRNLLVQSAHGPEDTQVTHQPVTRHYLTHFLYYLYAYIYIELSMTSMRAERYRCLHAVHEAYRSVYAAYV
jgi:hypothetical protein